MLSTPYTAVWYRKKAISFPKLVGATQQYDSWNLFASSIHWPCGISDAMHNQVKDSSWHSKDIVTRLPSQGRVRRSQVVSDTNSPRVLVSATSN
jgi:hypothetical protein